MDADQLSTELSEAFTSGLQMQVLSLVVLYQQLATALGLPMSWAAERLEEQAATMERELPKLRKRQFGETYVQTLRAYANQVAGFDQDGGGTPKLTLIDGGAD